MPSPSVALLRTQSDDRLVALAAAGHERAFEAIVERYRRPLLRYARRYLPESRAEDAVQQALVSAWTGLRRGDDVRDLRPWLHRIVHNAALNALRVTGYDYDELRETLEGQPGSSPDEAAERRAVVRGTLAGLAALPERQREALLQIAVEGRSQDEVAAGLGLSQGAVRQLVHRARTSLRAAATALTPLPLMTWMAGGSSGRADVALRIGELVAGAGAGATMAKAGAVAVIAGGAVAGPAIVRDAERPPAARPAPIERMAEERPREAAVASAPVETAFPVTPVAAGGGSGGEGERRGGEGSGRDDDRDRDRGEGRDGDDRREDRGDADDGGGRHGGGGAEADDDDGGGGRSGEDDQDDADDDDRGGTRGGEERSGRRGSRDDDDGDGGDDPVAELDDDASERQSGSGSGGEEPDDDDDPAVSLDAVVVPDDEDGGEDDGGQSGSG